MTYYLITFTNTHTAIAAQKFLTDKIDFCIMPTLREISNSCGISIRINTSSCKLGNYCTEEQTAQSIFQLMTQSMIPSNMYQIYYVSNGSIHPLTPNTD